MRCPTCRVVVPTQTSVCPKCRTSLRGGVATIPERDTRERNAPRTRSRADGRVAQTRHRLPANGADEGTAGAFELELERAFERADDEPAPPTRRRTPHAGERVAEEAAKRAAAAERQRQRLLE